MEVLVFELGFDEKSGLNDVIIRDKPSKNKNSTLTSLYTENLHSHRTARRRQHDSIAGAKAAATIAGCGPSQLECSRGNPNRMDVHISTTRAE